MLLSARSSSAAATCAATSGGGVSTPPDTSSSGTAGTMTGGTLTCATVTKKKVSAASTPPLAVPPSSRVRSATRHVPNSPRPTERDSVPSLSTVTLTSPGLGWSAGGSRATAPPPPATGGVVLSTRSTSWEYQHGSVALHTQLTGSRPHFGCSSSCGPMSTACTSDAISTGPASCSSTTSARPPGSTVTHRGVEAAAAAGPPHQVSAGGSLTGWTVISSVRGAELRREGSPSVASLSTTDAVMTPLKSRAGSTVMVPTRVPPTMRVRRTGGEATWEVL
mmetsp:Transcript_37754/g.88264  ORF Transcript_37754/g.88264 Transcript_37754/m.88264 type:complete len:278 (-) Transcript_37754:370-1203(-)